MDSDMRAVPKARPVAPYVGGKRQLSRALAARIEATPHRLYGEVFVGMAGVFFKRATAPKVEAINDLNRDVATFFRVLQNHYEALMDMLRWQLTSRAEFDRLNGQDAERLTDLQRAARFLYVQRNAFGGKVDGRSFGRATTEPARFDVTKLGPLLAAAHERLAGVWIECLDWETFLDRWDRPEALFFLDPPYAGSEHFYGRGLFAPADHTRLADRLSRLQGRFILTLSDTPAMRETFGRFQVETSELSYFIGKENGTPARELIVTGGGA